MGRPLWAQGPHPKRLFRTTWIARAPWRACSWCASGLCEVALSLAGTYVVVPEPRCVEAVAAKTGRAH